MKIKNTIKKAPKKAVLKAQLNSLKNKVVNFAKQPTTKEVARQLAIVTLGAIISKKIASRNVQYLVVDNANNLTK